ncbi:UDP-N-acetyl-alpha-D-glucosamine C6 dehydratase [Poriferisphaera corsica]|uniref:UDP-N-acetyl-alpha-D-glucosamine C6 dehydratase n=1 Tax=Poriferisphaera corsica TaxID=2528020 RepID=A0A517YVC7_9BACT|nr:SDR family NAD(P)-dependent oxidoreductase [Poriferisphaera corsica]QDU34146.1 UDP-N-acetyl-alpha-D-glucosamine C6 dehydratase [Poriferisphaera corsica]
MEEPVNVKMSGYGGRGRVALVVGTALSVGQLSHCLKVVDDCPVLLGCLTVRGAGEEAELGMRLLGGLERLREVLEKSGVGLVLVSLPMSMGEELRGVTRDLDRIGVNWCYMPTLSDQLNGRSDVRGAEHLHLGGGKVSLNSREPLDVAKLIDRQPRPLDEKPIESIISSKTVLITGAGGSIGSEIARIVCRFRPSKLVLMDRSENSLFEIDRELRRVYGEVEVRTVLGDITKRERTSDLVGAEKPDVIFHAAAHKHVPMMEGHPSEAVENNYFGTKNVADAAAKWGVERMVMISSDKAVNPSSVMGATKRLAELYVQWMNSQSETIFTMVRFGNVLGSACSVLPIWSEQLGRGGPVTVTDDRMTRYFMTIPEAAGLVLQAGAYAEGGEVFLLDMGQPIRIMDMAKRFVIAMGFEPDVDVKIDVTGARPGEKLFEELAYDGEMMGQTPHESIRVWGMESPEDEQVQQMIQLFKGLRSGNERGLWGGVKKDAVLCAIWDSVPEVAETKSLANTQSS